MGNANTAVKPGNLLAWLSVLETRHSKEIDMGLERVARVKNQLAIQYHCPVIMVAGTNGKGSTCAMLEAILMQAGYRVGLYSKPHFLDFNERARINGVPVKDEIFVQVFDQVETARGDISLTYFEFTTLAICQLMAQTPLDVVILEVGLGGRLDAVNVIDADVSIVTSVDIDHVDYLGDTREKIAFEKSGIIKTGVPVVTTCDGAALAVIAARAEELQCPMYVLSHLADSHDLADLFENFEIQYFGLAHEKNKLSDFVELLKKEFFVEANQPRFVSGLSGSYQRVNILTALIALGASGILTENLMASPEQRQTTIQSLKLGLSKASWPGRFEIFEDPKMILDGAHNPHGAKALRASLLEKFGQVNFVFLLTCFENKDAEELLHALLGPGDTIFAFAPESERKMHRPEYLLGIAQAAGAHAKAATVQTVDQVKAAAANVKVPEVKAPEVKVPVVKAPEVKVPVVKAPAVTAPQVKAPTVTAPTVTPPQVKMPGQ